MIKAIVFESNTGYTREYAQMLEQKTGLPAYEHKKAHLQLKAGDEILYMGWLLASSIKGYKKAAKNFNVKAVCGVGMQGTEDEAVKELVKVNGIKDIPLFYLRGGYDINKLRGIYKLMMNFMGKILIKQLESKENKTTEDLETIDMFKNGGSCVNAESLNPILEWLKKS